MPRRDDIPAAFNSSIKHEANGRRTVKTVDFVAELAKLNHEFSLREANRWIEFYRDSFKDISTEECERRTFLLYNYNGGGYR